ncbi:MAG: UvrD-helicase domain-containing protein [Spirochaetota bacterium]
MDLVKGLNESQKAAVLQTEGPVLILAGAGSGKTRVITHRIAHLIHDKQVHPLEICAVTFTNKAAAEMRDRVREMVTFPVESMMIKTFHSLCLYILRCHPEEADCAPGFTIYDTSLQESLLKEILKEMEIDTKEVKPAYIANRISSAKDASIGPDEYEASNKYSFDGKAIAEIYQIYERKKKERNALDFSDLIFRVVHLLRKNKEIKEKYNQRWRYLMIDEYQDTNKIQYELTRLLTSEEQNLCVVGDDDQSIYSWRGADIRNILDFEKDFPNTFTVKLEENYRSSKNIINAAAQVISYNQSRKNKTLFTNHPEGEKISIQRYVNENEEALAVLDAIKSYYRETGSYRSFAIFYRTNAQSRYFEDAIRAQSIPYKIYGGFRFYDRAEIKDLIAYLCVITNPLDSTSLLRIINTPGRGIGDTSVEKIKVHALDKGVSIFEALDLQDLKLRKQTLKKVRELYNTFYDLIETNEQRKEKLSKIAEKVITLFGIEEAFEKDGSAEAIGKLENVREFINAIVEYEEKSGEPSLEEYLNQISLITSEENNTSTNDNYLTLMTVHNSKGLEFDYVFLAGMEEGTFPHSMSLEDPGGVEEERRLCYVAITRAKKKLSISHCETNRKYGMVDYRDPSRFLDEIPEEYVSKETSFPKFKRQPSFAPRAGNYRKNTNTQAKQKSVSKDGSSQIRKGTKVKHKTYGVGKVLEVSGSGDNVKVKVAFGMSQKNFLLQYTPLEVL